MKEKLALDPFHHTPNGPVILKFVKIIEEGKRFGKPDKIALFEKYAPNANYTEASYIGVTKEWMGPIKDWIPEDLVNKIKLVKS